MSSSLPTTATVPVVSKKPWFHLKTVNPAVLDQKYGFHISYNLHPRKIPENKTKITDLDSSSPTMMMTNHPSTNPNVIQNGLVSSALQFSFLDESKKDHECISTMMKFLKEEHFPSQTCLHCFWCRHEFPYRPIGCPIQYVPHRILKTYQSEITKENYTLRENITPSEAKNLSENAPQIKLQKRDYYVMDGIFCSFNCCLAFIQDQKKKNILYIHSEYLLNKFYRQVFGENACDLQPAPSWRLLYAYGGNQTIDEFRKNFYKVDYQNIDNIILPFPNSKSAGFLFEKQIKI